MTHAPRTLTSFLPTSRFLRHPLTGEPSPAVSLGRIAKGRSHPFPSRNRTGRYLRSQISRIVKLRQTVFKGGVVGYEERKRSSHPEVNLMNRATDTRTQFGRGFSSVLVTLILTSLTACQSFQDGARQVESGQRILAIGWLPHSENHPTSPIGILMRPTIRIRPCPPQVNPRMTRRRA